MNEWVQSYAKIPKLSFKYNCIYETLAVEAFPVSIYVQYMHIQHTSIHVTWFYSKSDLAVVSLN